MRFMSICKPDRCRKAFVLLLLACLLLTGCTPIRVDGLQDYSKEDSSFSITKHLFPSDDFLIDYPYLDGDYHYYGKVDLGPGYDKAFAYLAYDPETYAEAKEHCLNQFNLAKDVIYACDNISFLEHLWYTIKDDSGEWVIINKFPRQFNMLGYDDASCTLYFIGYFNGDSKSAERTLAEENFKEFLKSAYGEYYDFDAIPASQSEASVS